MICRCGYQNEPGDFYCAQCGRKLSAKKGLGWIIAVVVALVLVAGSVAAWFLFSKEPAKEPEDTETVEDIDADEDPDEEQAHVTEDEIEETILMGWYEEGTYYYQEGELLKGQQVIDGEYYYFSEETGEKQTGWQNIGDSWYYYTAEGPAPGEGWYEDDKGWFYLEKDGKLYTGLPLMLGNAAFTVDQEGYLVSTVYETVTCTTETANVDGVDQEVLKLPGQVTGCTSLNFTVHEGTKISTMGGTPWVVWIRCDGVWIKLVQYTEFTVSDGEVSVLTFVEPVDMDAILITCGPSAKPSFIFSKLVCVK